MKVPQAVAKSPTRRWTKKEPRTIGPAPLSAEERLDGAQWYYYQWLSLAQLNGLPFLSPIDPEPGEI